MAALFDCKQAVFKADVGGRSVVGNGIGKVGPGISLRRGKCAKKGRGWFGPRHAMRPLDAGSSSGLRMAVHPLLGVLAAGCCRMLLRPFLPDTVVSENFASGLVRLRCRRFRLLAGFLPSRLSPFFSRSCRLRSWIPVPFPDKCTGRFGHGFRVPRTVRRRAVLVSVSEAVRRGDFLRAVWRAERCR